MAALDRLRTAAGTMVRGPAQRPLTPPTDPRRCNEQGDIDIGMNGRRHNAGCLTPSAEPFATRKCSLTVVRARAGASDFVHRRPPHGGSRADVTYLGRGSGVPETVGQNRGDSL